MQPLARTATGSTSPAVIEYALRASWIAVGFIGRVYPGAARARPAYRRASRLHDLRRRRQLGLQLDDRAALGQGIDRLAERLADLFGAIHPTVADTVGSGKVGEIWRLQVNRHRPAERLHLVALEHAVAAVVDQQGHEREAVLPGRQQLVA